MISVTLEKLLQKPISAEKQRVEARYCIDQIEKTLNEMTPLECYIYARDNGHQPALENKVLCGGKPFVDYLYARNIQGADITAHIKKIALDAKMDRDEKRHIREELEYILNKTKEHENE